MKDFFRKYKKLIIILVIALIFVVALICLYNFFAPDYKKSLYGNRLESIEKHKVSSKMIDKIEKNVKELEYIKSFNYNLKGKIMNFVIEVNAETSIKESKKVWDIIIEELEEKHMKYYDIQVFLIEKEESEVYPVIGYKHKTSDEIIWTK